METSATGWELTVYRTTGGHDSVEVTVTENRICLSKMAGALSFTVATSRNFVFSSREAASHSYCLVPWFSLSVSCPVNIPVHSLVFVLHFTCSTILVPSFPQEGIRILYKLYF